jgi:hypothetical protein
MSLNLSSHDNKGKEEMNKREQRRCDQGDEDDRSCMDEEVSVLTGGWMICDL